LYKVKDDSVREFIEKCLATASCRLSASELLRDLFLQTDGLASASLAFGYEAEPRPTGGEGETDRDREHLLLTGAQTNWSNAISSSSYEEALVEDYSCWDWYWDRDRDQDQDQDQNQDQDQDDDENAHIEEARRGIDLFHCQEDEEEEPIANLDISIKGKRKDDGAIFLRLRISDKDGTSSLQNSFFPLSFSSCFFFLSVKVCEYCPLFLNQTLLAELYHNCSYMVSYLSLYLEK
jgi:WNK lysine deficient protein kinase